MKKRPKGLGELLQGLLIGSSMSVPGISGGTVAVAAGCYEKILNAAGHPAKKEHRNYLFRLALGGLVGFFTAARFIQVCFRILPLTMTMVFAGAVAGGIFPDLAKATRQKIKANDALFFLLGGICVIAAGKLPPLEQTSPLLYFPLGLLLAAGLILPGISTSHLLVVFGLYDDVTGIQSGSDLIRLLPLLLGISAGIILESRPLAAAMKRYPNPCACLTLGFACGSFYPLIAPCVGNPGLLHRTAFQAVNGIILCVAAFVLAEQLRKKENLKEMQTFSETS